MENENDEKLIMTFKNKNEVGGSMCTTNVVNSQGATIQYD
jgi:hypothetical protein